MREIEDRYTIDKSVEPVDCVFPTLDCSKYIHMTLDAVYKEIPVKCLFVLDGGSKDGTLEILKEYPRVDIEIRPELTHAKSMDVLLHKVTTDWCVFVDNAKVLNEGWFDTMMAYRDRGEFLNSTRIIHYEFERIDPITVDLNKRAIGGPWLLKTDVVRNYSIDNKYNARLFDVLLRQAIESKGFRYGVIPEASHTLYLTEEERYTSHPYLKGSGLVFKIPELKVWNKKGHATRLEQNARGIVQYLEHDMVKDYFLDDHWYLLVDTLPHDWIKKTNPRFYTELKKWKKKRYIKAKLRQIFYKYGKRFLAVLENIFEKAVASGGKSQVKFWSKLEKVEEKK